jgi:hypothetical protein
MSHHPEAGTETERSESSTRPKGRSAAPIIVLLLLSPVIGEVLFGATRISTLFVLLPQVGTWGCASLIIREVVRRRGGGWIAILLLGTALAIAEECVIQQTSLGPLVGADVKHPYGRMLGVNWVYFLWALVYESVWIVALPIQLTELIYPSHRNEPWLRTRGLVISTLVFLFASFVAWYSWTQVFLPKLFPELMYHVPLGAVLIAIASITGLAGAALVPGHPSWPRVATNRPAPRAGLVGAVAFGLGLPWFVLIFLAYGAVPSLPWIVPMVAGVVWFAAAFSSITSWSRRSDWHDSSWLALIFGAILASMIAGFLIFWFGGAIAIDVIGKLVLNLIATALLAGLGRHVSQRSRQL